MRQETQFASVQVLQSEILSDDVTNPLSKLNFATQDLVEETPTALLSKIVNNVIVAMGITVTLTTDVAKIQDQYVNQTLAVLTHSVLSHLMVKACASVQKV